MPPGGVPVERVGWWGPPTATIEWCEVNYAYTTYVAEVWNS